MPSFSTIAQDPQIRDLVQSNTLMRQFKDALFPDLIYRADFAQMNSLLGYMTEHCCQGGVCEVAESPFTCASC